MPPYQELDNEQRRNMLNNFQLYDAFADALMTQRSMRGSLLWQETAGKEYLIRALDGRTRKSMGPRSPETEAQHAAFYENKARNKASMEGIKGRLKQQSAMCKALNTGRMPRLAGNILRHLAAASLQEKTITVIGTHALYGYEGMAGVQFETGILATNDLDMLWDARTRLKLSGAIPAEGLIGMLQQVDRSFAIMRKTQYRAVNRDGFMVDLLQNRVDMRTQPRNSFAAEDAFVAVEADMDWLISSPKVSAKALDEDGYPVPMSIPDPRAFAVHKAWLSARPDRDPIKKPRDAAQAVALFHLVKRLLPQFPFSDAALRAFPTAVREQAKDTIYAGTEREAQSAQAGQFLDWE